jgi:hypothetical protein
MKTVSFEGTETEVYMQIDKVYGGCREPAGIYGMG